MQRTAHIDFETRSACDLKVTGAYVYSQHPTTDVWCMAFAFNDGPVQLWTPEKNHDLAVTSELVRHIGEGGICVAHNAAFERVIFSGVMGPRYGWPVPKLEQWRCTMAMAYSMALPGSLEEAAAAVGLPQQKDMAGRRLMLQMAKPRKKEVCGTCSGTGGRFLDCVFQHCVNCGGGGEQLTWWDEAEKLQRLYAYCRQDVEVERQLEKRLLQLRPLEQQVWQLDQQINDRGVYIDKELCDAALRVVDASQDMLDKEMRQVTGGVVRSCSEVSNLVKWLNLKLLVTDCTAVESVDKESITEMLAGWDLPPECRRALELRQEASKTSTAKVKKMLEMRGEGGRMRGNLQYHGAGTGRWAARGAQLQNLPRPKIKDVPEAIDTILSGANPKLIQLLHGAPLSVVSDCIRGMIAAPAGFDIVAADFSNIEGRVVAWLAGQNDKLDAFRAYDAGTGPDLYLVAAGGIFGVAVEHAKPYRQIGKVAELSLGYQGGPNAFAKMAGNYGLKIGDQYEIVWGAARAEHREQAEWGWAKRGKKSGMAKNAWLAAEVIKVGWRDAHPKIVQLWYALEAAAMDAVSNPGRAFTAGHITYKTSGSFLWCRLPSGRALCYPYPRIMLVDTPIGEREAVVYKTVDGMTKKWGDKTFYGGLAAENVTQAVARDLMAEAMLRVDAKGYPPIITIHDEIVCEIPESFGELDEFEQLMVQLPAWATGLPVSAEAWRGKRYRK